MGPCQTSGTRRSPSLLGRVQIVVGGNANGSKVTGTDVARIVFDTTGTKATFEDRIRFVPIVAILHVHYYPVYGICVAVGLEIVPQHAAKYVSRFSQSGGTDEAGVAIQDCHGAVLSGVSGGTTGS